MQSVILVVISIFAGLASRSPGDGKALQRFLHPQRLAVPTSAWKEGLVSLQMILGPAAPVQMHYFRVDQQPEEVPAAVAANLEALRPTLAAVPQIPQRPTLLNSTRPQALHSSFRLQKSSGIPASGQPKPSPPLAGIGGGVTSPTGVFQRASKRPRRAPELDRPAAPATDMSFFLNLNRGAAPAAGKSPAAAVAATGPQLEPRPGSPQPSSGSSGGSGLGGGGRGGGGGGGSVRDCARAAERSPPACTLVTIPPGLESLLLLLKTDHDTLLHSTAGVDPDVSAAGFLDMKSLGAGLAAAAAAEQLNPGSRKALLRAYATLGVLQQVLAGRLLCMVLCV